jgi:hypothetical protein
MQKGDRVPSPCQGKGNAPCGEVLEDALPPAPAHGGAASPEKNERRAIAALRTLLSAEVAYSVDNGGLYDTPECLAAPWDCIPGFPQPPMLPPFLGREALAREESGYRREFHPGPASRTAGASASSVASFAYTAVPLEPGVTGKRAFCVDHTGTVCFTPDGRQPPVSGGRCQPCEIAQ